MFLILKRSGTPFVPELKFLGPWKIWKLGTRPVAMEEDGKGKGLAEGIEVDVVVLMGHPVEVLVEEMMAPVGEVVPVGPGTATAATARGPRWTDLRDGGSVVHRLARVSTAVTV